MGSGNGEDRECAACREVVSARLDGEAGDPAEESAADAHLATCAACRAWADRAARVTRLTRTGVAEPGPDLVAAVLAAAPLPRRERRTEAARFGLGAVALGQLALAVNGVVVAGAVGHAGAQIGGATPVHLVHESSAWNLALGVAFATAAAARSRAPGLVPVVGAFLGVLAVLSLLDVLAGRVEPGRLVGHVLVVVGFLLLLVVARAARGGGGGLRTGTAPEAVDAAGVPPVGLRPVAPLPRLRPRRRLAPGSRRAA